MVNHDETLDDIFGALSSAVRRRTLEELGRSARTASDLAAPHGMTLGGFMKHLRILAQAGLIRCTKQGRSVTCELAKAPLSEAARWLANREQVLNDRMDALGRHLSHRAQIAPGPAAAARTKGSRR